VGFKKKERTQKENSKRELVGKFVGFKKSERNVQASNWTKKEEHKRSDQ
jgi:hypothetical protein